MLFNNKIISQLHLEQSSALEWLDRLENIQLHYCGYSPSNASLSAELTETLAGLQLALTRLQQSLKNEQRQLLPLLKGAGETALMTSLQPQRNTIFDLGSQLLAAVRGLDPSAPGQTEKPKEYMWDNAMQLVPELSKQLIGYLYRAETGHLAMADYLLGDGLLGDSRLSTSVPAGDLSAGTGHATHLNSPVNSFADLSMPPLLIQGSHQ